jgi:hypothetical protein
MNYSMFDLFPKLKLPKVVACPAIGKLKCFYFCALCIAGMVSDKAFSLKDFEKLEIITGTWVTKRKDGQIVETWKKDNASNFSGVSYRVQGNDTIPLEVVKLYFSNGDIIYAPVTAGQNDDKEVLFRLKSANKKKYIFENPSHDFPQRIVYDFKTADSLHAFIDGNVEGKPMHIDYFYIRK